MATRPLPPPLRGRVATATEALGVLLKFEGPADGVLTGFYRHRRHMGGQDRAFVSEVVYTVMRRLRTLEHVAGARDPRRLVLAALTLFLGVPPAELGDSAEERTWLRSLRLPELTGPVGFDWPDWLAERLVGSVPEAEWPALAHALQQPPPLDLRFNPLKAEPGVPLREARDTFLKSFKALPLEATPTPWSPLGLRVHQRFTLQRHPLVQEGWLEIQDEGSQLLSLLVEAQAGERVVDFCAGAGGKTLVLGALMQSKGRLLALDVLEKRLERLRIRTNRAGLSNVQTHAIESENDAWLKRHVGKFDRVLVDAPCSGLGTLRRNPDMKWRVTPAEVDRMVGLQASILRSAARLVRPGGRLVYGTCSLLAAENGDQVDAFLKAHEDFEEADCEAILARQGALLSTGRRLALVPHRHQTDGFFAAVLTRKVSPEVATA